MSGMQSFEGLDSEKDSITQDLWIWSNGSNDSRLPMRTKDSSVGTVTLTGERGHSRSHSYSAVIAAVQLTARCRGKSSDEI